MGAASIGRSAVRWIFSPLLYFLALIPTVFGAIVVLTAMDYGGFLYRFLAPVDRYGALTPGTDETSLVAVLAVGGLVFGLAGWVLAVFEKLRRPKIIDHFRRCVCLYIVFVVLNAAMMPEYIESYRTPGYPAPEFQLQVVWLLVACAILLDALVLAWRRHRPSPTAQGEIA